MCQLEIRKGDKGIIFNFNRDIITIATVEGEPIAAARVGTTA